MIIISTKSVQEQLTPKITIDQSQSLMDAIEEYLAVMLASTIPSVLVNDDDRLHFSVLVDNAVCRAYVGSVRPEPFALGLNGATVVIGVFVDESLIQSGYVDPRFIPERSHDAAPLSFTIRLTTERPRRGYGLDYEIEDGRLRTV